MDLPAAAAAAGGDADVKLSDEVSSNSVDGDADLLPAHSADDRHLDDYGVPDNHHTCTAAGSSPSPARQAHQQQQQLGHRRSSWDDVPSSFQRFPALSQLHYSSYPSLTGSSEGDVARLAAASDSSSWTMTGNYCSRLIHSPSSPYPARGHSAAAASSGDIQPVRPSDCYPSSLLHSAAVVHQWYASQTSPQTLLT